MIDTHTKRQRSQNMSAIRSFGNKTTEAVFSNLLKKEKISGWRRHIKKLPGKPDFSFLGKKTAVFLDGCFWHGCRICKLSSKSNKRYWRPKIKRNTRRDREINRELRKNSWRVLRVWEHDIKKNSEEVIKKVKTLLAKK